MTLRDWLITNNISVQKCADDTKISPSAIYMFWNGTKNPSYRNKKILEKYTKGEVAW